MIRRALHIILLISLAFSMNAQHPVLILNKESVPELRRAMNEYPMWNDMVSQVQQQADEAILEAFDVPVPVDPAGGYTHGKHKQNGKLLKRLGAIYQTTADDKYARYAKNIFMAYAQMYPSLGAHPVKASYAPGRLFWQQLNDAVWLVDAIQGYDCIYEYLQPDERKTIEEKLLRPYADFLSIESKFVFNRIHNHGVWAVAAVGMTGIVLDDDELVCRSLYGIKENNKPNKTKIDANFKKQFEAGFLTQTASLFSPDGYYTEGPYYQRYAMTPFLLFAQSLDNNIPSLKIMEFEDGIFYKAIETLIQLTDANGGFFSINDNLKGMSLNAPEMVWAVDMLYAKTKNPELLDIALTNPTRHINSAGLEVIKGLSDGLAKPISKKSITISDGTNGDAGGIAILRDDENSVCAVLKGASQGLVHGHFDRLNLMFFHEENEVLSDYGAARFVNVKAKEGGRYLPENETFGKQTIAHNTVVINEQSQFDGKFKVANEHHADILFSDYSNPEIRIACAIDSTAYEGKVLTRVSAVFASSHFNNPVLIDLFKVDADIKSGSYDLPFHFLGQILDVGFEYSANSTAQVPLGTENGYQHIWKQATGTSEDACTGITWMYNRRVYSITTSTDKNTELIIGESGANDPAFNLRHEPVFIVRQKGARSHTFASIIESHGTQNPNTESVHGQEKEIKNIELLKDEEAYTALKFESIKGTSFTLLVYTGKRDESKNHTLELEGKTYNWSGAYKLIEN